MKEKAKQMVEFSQKMSPTKIIELNVRGEMIRTSLASLTKISESRLAEVFCGKIELGHDLAGRVFIDSDAEVFRHVLNYLSFDRTWLPPEEDITMRNLVEHEIKRWGLDKGLSKPSTLTTDIAKEF